MTSARFDLRGADWVTRISDDDLVERAGDAAFERALHDFEQARHQPVDHRGGEVRPERLEGAGDDELGAAQELDHRDDRHQRSVLDQANQGVAQAGEGHPRCLRQDDEPHGLRGTEAQAGRGLALPPGNIQNRRPHRLRKVGGGVEGERDDPACDRPERQAEAGQAVVDDKNLDKQRRSPDKRDKHAAEPAQGRKTREPGQRHQKPQR